MKNKLFNLLDIRPWYIFHIILLVIITFGAGSWIAVKLGIFDLIKIRMLKLIFVFFYYSLIAWLYDSLFHSLMKWD